MLDTILHVAAEILIISAGIFAIWAIHATVKGK
jgi:hypothetical protein